MIDQLIKDTSEKVADYWRQVKGSTLRVYVFTDYNFNSVNIAQGKGFTIKDQETVLCILRIDRNRFEKMSKALQEFVIAHEFGHCLAKQTDKSSNYRSELIISNVQNKASTGVTLLQTLESTSNGKTLKEQIIFLANSLNEPEHKCIDMIAKKILGITKNDQYVELLNQLWRISPKSQDIIDRLDTAKKMDYESCPSI